MFIRIIPGIGPNIPTRAWSLGINKGSDEPCSGDFRPRLLNRCRRRTAVNEYVARAKVIGITWPIPPEIDDAELERRLFVPAAFHDGSVRVVPCQ